MFAKLLLLLVASTVYCLELQVINTSDTPVFVQVLGTQYPDPFTLATNQKTIFTCDDPWAGRIWGRTDCNTTQTCASAGDIPASLAELSTGFGMSFYDLTLIDGFNINLSIEPIDGHDDGTANSCKKSECLYPIFDECPEELKLFNSSGDLVSCQSACSAFGDDEYCCAHLNIIDDCRPFDWPVNYAQWFKDRCPDAFSYRYDDSPDTFYCDSTRYLVTFL